MLNVGPFYTNETKIFCFNADEYYYFSETIPEYSTNDNQEYLKINDIYELSLLPLCSKNDYLFVNKEYKNHEKVIQWYKNQFKKIGLSYTDNIIYSDGGEFYKDVKATQKQTNIKNIIPIGYSYKLAKYFEIKNQLELSKYLNRKTNFIKLQKKYGFNSPNIDCIDGANLKEYLNSNNLETKDVFVKIDGVGGGENVFNGIDINNNIKKIKKNSVLIQKKLSDELLELTVELIFFENDYKINNILGSIMDGNNRYGAYYKKIELNEKQIKEIDKLAKGIIKEGYGSKNGNYLGVDCFIDKENLTITEINCRYISTTPPQIILEKLGIINKIESIALYDYVNEQEFDKYMKFCENNCYSNHGVFSIIPISFSGYQIHKGYIQILFIVIGNFDEFYEEIKIIFSEYSFEGLSFSYNQIKQFNRLHKNILSINK